MSEHSTPRNFLLKNLPETVRNAILDSADYVHLDLREYIVEPNKPIEFVDFPEFGVMSVLKPMEDGTLIEIATVGKEGMIGLPVALGVGIVEDLAFCQVEGASWRIPAADFCKLFKEHKELSAMCLRYSVVYADQVSRNVGCNCRHTLPERCARWLLMTHDRCEGDEFSLTQEFLAAMLGASRTSVNLAAITLSKAQLIRYARGKIAMRDYMAKIMNSKN